MSDQDVFDDQSKEDEPKVNDFSELLKNIKNSSGEQKYKDVETALKALATSQQYIPELETKLDDKDTLITQLKEELTKRNSVEEVIKALRDKEQRHDQDQPQDKPTGLDAEQAEALFEKFLSKREQEAERDKNIKAVTSALKEKFGDKASQVFYDKAEELGLSRPEINKLAGTSPAAVLAYFEVKSNKTGFDVSVKNSNVTNVETQEEIVLGRRKGPSVIGGATTADKRAEADYVKKLVNKLNEEGVSIDDLSDPKIYRKYFG